MVLPGGPPLLHFPSERTDGAHRAVERGAVGEVLIGLVWLNAVLRADRRSY